MRLDEPDHDVGATLEAAPPLVEHGAGLADAGRRTQVHAEATGRPDPFVFSFCAHPYLFAGPRHCVGTLGRRSDGQKAVTDVTPGKLVTRGTYQHNLLGIAVTLAGLAALAGRDAARSAPT